MLQGFDSKEQKAKKKTKRHSPKKVDKNEKVMEDPQKARMKAIKQYNHAKIMFIKEQLYDLLEQHFRTLSQATNFSRSSSKL